MNVSALVVFLIGFTALAGMGCILLDSVFGKTKQLNTAPVNHYAKPKPQKVDTTSFIEDMESVSVILEDD